MAAAGTSTPPSGRNGRGSSGARRFSTVRSAIAVWVTALQQAQSAAVVASRVWGGAAQGQGEQCLGRGKLPSTGEAPRDCRARPDRAGCAAGPRKGPRCPLSASPCNAGTSASVVCAGRWSGCRRSTSRKASAASANCPNAHCDSPRFQQRRVGITGTVLRRGQPLHGPRGSAPDSASSMARCSTSGSTQEESRRRGRGAASARPARESHRATWHRPAGGGSLRHRGYPRGGAGSRAEPRRGPRCVSQLKRWKSRKEPTRRKEAADLGAGRRAAHR